MMKPLSYLLAPLFALSVSACSDPVQEKIDAHENQIKSKRGQYAAECSASLVVSYPGILALSLPKNASQEFKDASAALDSYQATAILVYRNQASNILKTLSARAEQDNSPEENGNAAKACVTQYLKERGLG